MCAREGNPNLGLGLVEEVFLIVRSCDLELGIIHNTMKLGFPGKKRTKAEQEDLED